MGSSPARVPLCQPAASRSCPEERKQTLIVIRAAEADPPRRTGWSCRAMAASWRFTQHPLFCFIVISTLSLSLLFSGEFPAEHIDPAAIDLTPLVNTLINSSQSGQRQLFSLLSVTSYSSLALHKLTLLLYNISSIRSLENDVFRRRFCYCVSNETNDLTDFTAILLDVMGNSSSYLQELFKSASIVSVSQRNNSDCIYICVMAGKMGEQVPALWDVGSITPLFNQTIVEGPHRDSRSRLFKSSGWHQLPTNLSHMSSSGPSWALTSRVHSTAHASPPPVDETAAATETTTAQRPRGRHAAGPPRREARHGVWKTRARRNHENRGGSGPARAVADGGEAVADGGATTVGAHKLQPCVLELCKFFSQCLCRPLGHKTPMKRFCEDSHRWYEKHTAEVCRRVRRVSFSRNLKQRCLTKMCLKL
ncbi:uncharacterized protein hhla1 [Salarias fasciatus]|uniref:uncharacterized protein hhla1 n=1 Tax=Salarias fasciatus TaxID=181472 RepID=UPI0011766221|nr:HERV-H LTR-associating protein 1 [Salarias fasciatus]